MTKREAVPTALTIAGSDSGGGAGIQADLKTFAGLRVHGTCALTCLTAQNPRRVSGIQTASPTLVRAQIEAVFEELRPNAIKTGMLYSAALIRAVTTALPERNLPPLVVDPVMVATSGARLLQQGAIRALTLNLLPRATLITPNLDEASLLLQRPLREPEDLRQAAHDLLARFGCAILVKGGHLPRMKSAIDFYYDGTTELLLEAPFVRNVNSHGTGCTYAAAIAGYLALGCKLPQAVQMAKQLVTQAIASSVRVRRHDVLGFCAPAPSHRAPSRRP